MVHLFAYRPVRLKGVFLCICLSVPVRLYSGAVKTQYCALCVKSMKFGTLMYFFMMNHLRKGHNLIGHPFGRNLHKSNMTAIVNHENAYVVHLCIETCNSVGLYYMIIQIILNVKA